MTNHAPSIRDCRLIFDLVSYGRRGPGEAVRLLPAEIEHIARTVGRVPEVMIKISGGGTNLKAVAAHLRYIDRHGELDIETDEGERVRGEGVERSLVEDWDLDAEAAELHSPYTATPGRKATKLVHNVILSMPAGTSADRLLAASRDFVREQFALKHRYAMVLHTDQNHPHVHVVVKAMSEQGGRLNIRKATLREWRQQFAWHLRQHGVAANATERAIRGVTAPRKLDGIYRAMRNPSRYSTHIQDRLTSAAADLLNGIVRVESGKAKLLRTRMDVERGWRAVRDILMKDGKTDLAMEVKWFVDRMAAPMTEHEWLISELQSQVKKQAPVRKSRLHADREHPR